MTDHDNSNANNPDTITEGEDLTPDDLFWLNQMRQLAADSIKSVEEAAKQLIAMITVLQGIYAAVLAFSGIKEVPKGDLLATIAYALPIALWLIALGFAIAVFKVKRHTYYVNSPDSAHDTFKSIADRKYKHLNRAYAILTLSLLVALIAIAYWLYLPAPEPSLAPTLDLRIR